MTTRHTYIITVTYTTCTTNRRVTRDIAIEAATPTEASAKIAALVQTPEYQVVALANF